MAVDQIVTSLKQASQSWKSFDWTGKRQQNDTALSQSKEAREQSVAARKQLADTTKQFKRSVKNVDSARQALSSSPSPESIKAALGAIDGLSKECRVIVKAYQEEIDNLTRRCKSSESSFGSLCEAMGKLSDPTMMLAAASDEVLVSQERLGSATTELASLSEQVQKQQKEIAKLKAEKKSETGKAGQEELVRLRQEVAEYEVEFRSLKNQDITIRKLEGRIVELQNAGEKELEEKLEKAQQELAETEGRRAAEALDREAAMERKVENLELQLKAERAGREATQTYLLDANEGAGEREAAWEAQRRILVDDAERLRQVLHHATRERDELRLKVGAMEGGKRSAPPSGGITVSDMMLERQAFEAEVADLSHTANSLREELRTNEERYAEDRRGLQSKIDSLCLEKDKLTSSLISVEAQLAAAPSQAELNNMRRELRILKRLEYNADDVDAAGDPEMTGDEGKDLESVLVAKLRRAESDLVKERTSKSEHVQKVEELMKQTKAAMEAKEEAEKLVQSLEEDLERAIATPQSQTKPSKTKEPTIPEEGAATLQSILDPDAPAPVIENPVAKKSMTEKAEDDHSVATIVMAQRDRLRARCEAVEAERDSFKRELQVQVQASESLKTDNTKLYEKVRYLQNYNGSRGGGTHSRGRKDRDLDLEALEQRYEASVDPFRQFGRAERQRKLQEMSPMERTVFVVAKTVLGTKEMRTALFVYVTCMHLLVFMTVTTWSHGCAQGSDNDHLAHLPPDIQQAANDLRRVGG